MNALRRLLQSFGSAQLGMAQCLPVTAPKWSTARRCGAMISHKVGEQAQSSLALARDLDFINLCRSLLNRWQRSNPRSLSSRRRGRSRTRSPATKLMLWNGNKWLPLRTGPSHWQGCRSKFVSDVGCSTSATWPKSRESKPRLLEKSSPPHAGGMW